MNKIIIILLIIGLSGCSIAMPIFTKKEIYQMPGATFIKKGNYLDLAHYWDDNAKKQMIDVKGASYLMIWEKEKEAEITVGNGPYYALIQLKEIDESTTRITSYGNDSMNQEWVNLFRNAPEKIGGK